MIATALAERHRRAAGNQADAGRAYMQEQDRRRRVAE